MEYVLTAENLSKRYKSFKALSGLSMHIEKGSIYGFVGKNGAGKTTLIRLICGMQFPTSGCFSLYGVKNTDSDFVKTRRRMGAVVETPSVYLDMTAEDNLKEQYPEIICTTDDFSLLKNSDVLFLALHPPVISEVLSAIKPYVKEDVILISLAPKITVNKLKNMLGGIGQIARVNPSAPGIIHQGINPVAFEEGMELETQTLILDFLKVLGNVMVVDESKIEAYAVISAMGPTYFWFQLQKLKELGVSYGLEEEEAKKVILEMLNGAANTLFYSNIPEEVVMDLVPVRPLSDYEEVIKGYYSEKLNAIFEKIKPL
jgi:pyrroline-5-carboxylate reductase